MQAITWHSFDLKSGRRGQRLQTRTMGSVSRLINEATETTIDVQFFREGRPVAGWDEATLPARTMAVALDENEWPVFAGMVYRRVAKNDEFVTLSLVTLEAYFDRRYVDHDAAYVGADQASEIAVGLIQQAAPDGIDFTIDAPPSGLRRDRTYLVDEDKTILSVLTELAGVEDGIEFTIDLGWRDADRSVLDRVVRVRNRVGLGSAARYPTASFNLPGSVVDFEYVEDYSADNGANGVMAVSSGESDARPESRVWSPTGVLQGGWPLFEYRFTPSTSITDIATLDAHAVEALHEMWDGLKELTLEANLDAAPRVNSAWFLGDDVAVSLTCPRFPARRNIDGILIPGYFGTVRCIGWEIDYDARLLKPRLVEVEEVQVDAR